MTISPHDPERIWLQSYHDSVAVLEDRQWCPDKVWPQGPDDHEPTEYVRADLVAAIMKERDEARRQVFLEAAEWHDSEAARYVRKSEQRKRATHEISAAVFRTRAQEA